MWVNFNMPNALKEEYDTNLYISISSYQSLTVESDNILILHVVQNKNRFNNWLNEFYHDSDVLLYCFPCNRTVNIFWFSFYFSISSVLYARIM